MTTTMITLVSLDDQRFEVPLKAADLSEMIKNTLNRDEETMADSDAPKSYPPVELLRVNGRALEQVVKFMIHYVEEPMKEITTPLGGNTLEEVVTQEWYRNFINNVPQDYLSDVISASNYLGLEALLDLATLKLTFMLSGKPIEEVRAILKAQRAPGYEDDAVPAAAAEAPAANDAAGAAGEAAMETEGGGANQEAAAEGS